MPTIQPSFSGPIERVDGHLDVGEEHLVELGLACHLTKGTYLDPRQRHVHQEERDALVLRAFGSVRAIKMPQSE